MKKSFWLTGLLLLMSLLTNIGYANDTIFMTWTAEAGEEKPLRVGVSVGESWTAGQETFVVDWGDGTYLSSAYFSAYGDTSFAKTYAEAGSYDVMVYTTAPEVRMDRFDCNGTSEKSNGVSALDVSQNAVLEILHCENNALTSLDVSQNAALEYLICDNNALTSLDVSGCAALWILYCGNNALTSLDVSQNATLSALYCPYNALTSLDVSQNAMLSELYCPYNALTSLDVSQNAMLWGVSCADNALSALDVSQNAALRYLFCDNNALSALDVRQNAALERLLCYNNALSALDLSQNAMLETFECGNNRLIVDLDADHSMDLDTLPGMDVSRIGSVVDGRIENSRLFFEADSVTYCYATGYSGDRDFDSVYFVLVAAQPPVTPPDEPEEPTYTACDTIQWTWTVDGAEQWRYFETYGTDMAIVDWGDGYGDTLKRSDLGNRSMMHRYATPGIYDVLLYSKNDQHIRGINVSYAYIHGNGDSLAWGNCDNRVTQLDVSKCKTLESLVCDNNALTKLDVSQNVLLVQLCCFSNMIEKLDVSNNPKLSMFYCGGNPLKTLDVSNNPELEYFDIQGMKFTNIDVRHNPHLRDLYATGNEFSEIDVSNNQELEFVTLAANQLSLSHLSGMIEFWEASGMKVKHQFLDQYIDILLGKGDTLYGLMSEMVLNGVASTVDFNAIPPETYRFFDDGKLVFVQPGDYHIVLTNESVRDYLYMDDSYDTSLVRVYYHITVTGDPEEPTYTACDTISLTWTAEAGEEKPLRVGVSVGESWTAGQETFVVDWGDGTYLCANSYDTPFTKTYAESGSYEVKVYTTAPEVRMERFYCNGTWEKSNGNGVSALDVSGCAALKGLYCYDNALSALDVSQNAALKGLYCSSNGLSALDVSQNAALEMLYCYDNALSALDVRQNAVLRILYCSDNALSALDVSQNTALTDLDCDNNALSVLDVSQNPALEALYCDNNVLSVLDVSQNAMLESLGCSNNALSALDVSQNAALRDLDCSDNALSALDVSQNAALIGLSCSSNALYTLDVSQNAALKRLYCYNNALTTLDVSQNAALEMLYCSDNALSALDLSQNAMLETFECYNNRLIVDLDADHSMDLDTLPGMDVSRIGSVTGGYIDGTRLFFNADEVTYRYATHFPGDVSLGFDTVEFTLAANICDTIFMTWTAEAREEKPLRVGVSVGESWTAGQETFVVDWGDGTYLYATHYDYYEDTSFVKTYAESGSYEVMVYTTAPEVRMERFGCGVGDKNNGVSSLDISGCGLLRGLGCANNGLSTLDVRRNTRLSFLECSSNNLSSLDVSQNIILDFLHCYNNQLTSLDVSHNVALRFLGCEFNNLLSLDVSHNVSLENLECETNHLTSLDVSHNQDLVYLDCGNNQLDRLDVLQNPALETLICYNNALSALDVSQNAALEWLWCDDNGLSALDLSKNAALWNMSCHNNRLIVDLDADHSMDLDTLPGMDVSRIGSVTGGYIDGTRLFFNADEVTYRYATHFPGDVSLGFDTVEFTLTAAQQPVTPPDDPIEPDTIVPGNGAGWIWLASAGEEKEIAFKGTGKGFRVDWGDSTTSEAKGAPGFDETLAAKDSDKKLEHRYAEEGVYTVTLKPLSESGRLTDLDVSDGRLVALRFGDASMLTDLDCSENLLTELDLSGAAKLKALDCSENLLPSLDLTACAQLQEADFSENRLTTVSLPTHSNLKAIDGKDNRLSLSGLYDLLSQRVKKASYGFDPQGDSVSVAAGDVLDLSSEMLLGGKSTAYTVYDADGRPASKADYTETGGQFRFTEAGRCYRLSLTNAAVMEYKDGNPQKPVTFVWNIIVSGVANEDLAGSDAGVYVRNRTICLSEDLGEMRVYTMLGRCIYKGHGLVAEVPCAGLYVVQAGGHTWKVVVR